MDWKNNLFYYILTLVGNIILGSNGLKDVLLAGPYFIRKGEDVFLSCQYDMEKDQLYAVKWYRGSAEFYRFVPKEAPPQKVFYLHDHPINIDVQHSNSHQILVRNASFFLSGTYKCVVSAESTFQTLSDVKNIMVVAVGYDPPKLQLDRISYHPGDRVQANCSIGKTFPGPNITWYLNDLENHHLINQTIIPIPDKLDPSLTTYISQVSLILPESYLPSKLTCKATLMDLYSEIAVKKIQPVPRNYTFIITDGIVTRSSKSSSSSSSSLQSTSNNGSNNNTSFGIRGRSKTNLPSVPKTDSFSLRSGSTSKLDYQTTPAVSFFYRTSRSLTALLLCLNYVTTFIGF